MYPKIVKFLQGSKVIRYVKVIKKRDTNIQAYTNTYLHKQIAIGRIQLNIIQTENMNTYVQYLHN